MKILITGNSGYIGSHLTKILLTESSIDIHGLDKNLPNLKVNNFIQQNIINDNWSIEQEYDCIVHLAAEVSVSNSVKNPTLYYQTNTLGTINLLRNVKTKRFIFASTGAAELMNSPYGISKKAAEEIVSEFCIDKNIPYTIFRFYNVIGSDGILPSNTDGLMWNLINAKKTGIFNLYGVDYNTRDGSAIRDYVHVNEICRSIIKVLDNSSNQIENLGHGYGTTVKEMIDLFKKTNNCDFRVNLCERRSGDVEKSVLNNPSQFMEKLYNIEQLLKL